MLKRMVAIATRRFALVNGECGVRLGGWVEDCGRKGASGVKTSPVDRQCLQTMFSQSAGISRGPVGNFLSCQAVAFPSLLRLLVAAGSLLTLACETSEPQAHLALRLHLLH